MTLPRRNEKDYLETKSTWLGFSIVAQKQHAIELQALFAQHGLPCKREADVRPGEDALRFESSVDRNKVNEILTSYKAAKGS